MSRVSSKYVIIPYVIALPDQKDIYLQPLLCCLTVLSDYVEEFPAIDQSLHLDRAPQEFRHSVSDQVGVIEAVYERLNFRLHHRSGYALALITTVVRYVASASIFDHQDHVSDL